MRGRLEKKYGREFRHEELKAFMGVDTDYLDAAWAKWAIRAAICATRSALTKRRLSACASACWRAKPWPDPAARTRAAIPAALAVAARPSPPCATRPGTLLLHGGGPRSTRAYLDGLSGIFQVLEEDPKAGFEALQAAHRWRAPT
jgi:hypothetical protein